MAKTAIIIISFFLSFTSCSLFQSEAVTVNDLLPRDTDVPGWMRTDSFSDYRTKDIKKYNREYEGINIDKLAFCVYRSLDNPEIEIKLEVIKFNSVLDAYGFFSTKRGPGIFEISLMNEYYTNTISLVHVGEYVLYAISEKTGSLLKNDLKTFVNIPVLYIGKNYTKDPLPAKFNILRGPEGYGILYSGKPYHKLPFLSKICFTQWIWNKKITDVFLAESDSFYDAFELFKKSTETGYTVTSASGTHTAFKKEADDSYSFISVDKRWIFGCWSVQDIDDGRKILGEIQSKIQNYKEISQMKESLSCIMLSSRDEFLR